MKVLFIVPYPEEGPSNRLRVSQFLPYLKEAGIRFKLRPFVFKMFYRILYSRGNYLKKIMFFIWSFLGRLVDIARLLRYDVVFIHREACPLGPPFFEWAARKFRKRIIFDFDDAIYLPNRSKYNNFIEWFKNPRKVPYIVKISDRVIVGNKFLADFVAGYNKNVEVIPTCVDTETYYNTDERCVPGRITIGWIGSATTVEYLHMLKEVFVKLIERYPYLRLKIIGGEFKINGLDEFIINKKWSLENEVSDLRSMDIGIMPMPDNEWTRGKCCFKALLYMSMRIPCVCSPVWLNKEIIKDGVNGFLALSDREWLDKLSFLIESEQLRKTIGLAGRRTVEEEFSVKENSSRYIKAIEKVGVR